MRIISILNHKGGVGKTTTAANLSVGLAMQGKRTLAIDLDGQANLSFSFGLNPHSTQSTIYHALRGDIKGLPAKEVMENLSVVPAHYDLGAIEIELVNEPGKEYLLKELLEPYEKDYDFVIIDCPPALGFLAFNALTTSTDVIIPIEADAYAVQGTIKVQDLIGKIQRRINTSLQVLGILVTKYDQRTKIAKEVTQVILEHSKARVLKPFIRKNVLLAEAALQQQDIFSYAPKSTGAEDYLELSKQIING